MKFQEVREGTRKFERRPCSEDSRKFEEVGVSSGKLRKFEQVKESSQK